MSECRELERALRAPDFTAPSEAMRRHAAGCPACATALRAALLLRLGSDRPQDATTRPGFETRLRDRIAAAGGFAAAPERSATGDWSAAIVGLLRPALGAAAACALIAAALFYQAASSVTTAQTADLTSILSIDPALGVVLSDDTATTAAAAAGADAAAPPSGARPAETPR